ncbi:MAG: alpha/beta hydrolase [Thermoproteota archaeon]|nr:alpha/beta hydrolase [Thermoproteota archaeon]
MTVASANNNNNDNNNDDRKNIQNTIKVIDVNSYKIRYYDYCSNDSSSNISTNTEENQAVNCKKIVIILQERSIEEWLNVASILARKGFRLLIPELIGFRYNDKPVLEYTNDFFIYDFFKAFLDHLGISKASIIGSSFGAHIATEFAIRFSGRVEKLILVSPESMSGKTDRYIIAALYPEVTENVYEAFREMVYDANTLNEEIVKDFVNWMKLPNSKYRFMSTVLAARYAAKLKHRLSNITAPTLIVWGDNDKMIPLQYARQYEEIPESRLVVIKNCGHIPHIEKPTRFSDILVGFL